MKPRSCSRCDGYMAYMPGSHIDPTDEHFVCLVCGCEEDAREPIIITIPQSFAGGTPVEDEGKPDRDDYPKGRNGSIVYKKEYHRWYYIVRVKEVRRTKAAEKAKRNKRNGNRNRKLGKNKNK